MQPPGNPSAGRIGYIDFLKFIGLTCIILAHTGAPDWLMALRSFDVPFMVILSAMLGERSYRRYRQSHASPLRFYTGRVQRLVIPTWLFLLFYFGLRFALSGKLFAPSYYLASFSLTRYGIGYVWVIRVYLYSALMIPLCSRIKLSKGSVLCAAAIYIGYEIACYFQIAADNKFVDSTFYYIIPYGVLTFLGYHYHALKPKQRLAVMLASFALFIGCGLYYWHVYGSVKLVVFAKYPARLYYLSFGVAMSFLLLILFENRPLKMYGSAPVRFISRNSLWIYLWHILALDVYSYLRLPEIWYLKLAAVYGIALGIVFAVNKLTAMLEAKRPLPWLRYFKG